MANEFFARGQIVRPNWEKWCYAKHQADGCSFGIILETGNTYCWVKWYWVDEHFCITSTYYNVYNYATLSSLDIEYNSFDHPFMFKDYSRLQWRGTVLGIKGVVPFHQIYEFYDPLQNLVIGFKTLLEKKIGDDMSFRLFPTFADGRDKMVTLTCKAVTTVTTITTLENG